MHESPFCFHNIEWPPAGARLAGPVAWLRGWIVGKPGHDFTDVRVRHNGGTHLGVLGLPRTDLATHFGSARPWIPAEFTLGVPVSSGSPELVLEAMDADGRWHDLQHLPLTIAYDGQPPPRVDGRIETRPDGSWTVRDAHHPFHGHLDAPGSTPTLRSGRLPVFGWLLDETRPLAAVLATADGVVFNHLEHSRNDAALAARIAHPRASTARLRGAVDFPATASVPACLRMYAVSPDGRVTLCFAGRVQPAETAPPSAPARFLANAPREQSLPALPSGRPRRLLVVLRSLFPSDAALRVLDIVRHLVVSHRWAARIVTTEDGPLRRDFEAAGAESLVLETGALLAASSADTMQHALHTLERRIRFDHLDAVIVNDAVCGWAMALARRRNIPVLFDCSATDAIAPDATGLPEVQALQREGWQSANLVCFASTTAAAAQHAALAGRPSALVGQWHTPGLMPATPRTGSRVVLAPLRTADWLARRHPAEAARWIFRQGPAVGFDDELLANQDDAAGPAALQHAADWRIDDVALCLGPLFGRGPLRPVIDAAAAGIPVVAPRLPLTAELFAHTRVPLVDPANPLALAHALLAWSAHPDSYQHEATTAAPDFRAAHDPAQLLPRWERLLETVIATARNVT